MTALKKSSYVILIIAGFFFIGGLGLWLQAENYQPKPPRQNFPRHFSYREECTALPITRYQNLQNGQLFFNKLAAVVVQISVPKMVFESKLILWGISGGQNSRAVVGVDPKSNQQTEIVKVGDVYAGETIVSIGQDSVVVRNSSGTGRIYLNKENSKTAP